MATKRDINISIHDYNRNKLCDIYNSNTRTSGQAYNIVIEKEASGYKQLRFTIPYKVMEGNELVDNHRAQHLKNEYLVSVTENGATDWFYISEPNIEHNKKTLTVSLTCQHVSSLLRMRNLYLELDDTNGIGTCSALATTILNGTGWALGDCDTFYEADGVTEKVRTLKASNKTGAYQMIVNLCNLFNARPIFNGDDRTVSIITFNPFHNPLDPAVPLVDNIEKVIELNYGKAMDGVSRKLDTSSLITRLHVEGEYGDDGYVGIENAPANTSGLDFLTDFSYFQTLGLFTGTHTTALSTYLSSISVAKAAVKQTTASVLAKETDLMELWGTCNYGCFDVTSRVNGTTLNVSMACTNMEDAPTIEAGQDVVLMNTNGTHLYTTVASGSLTQIIIADSISLAAHTKLIVFFTPSSGDIGGKESALVSSEKTRDDGYDDLDGVDSLYTTLFSQATAPVSGMVANDLWVDIDASPIAVYRYLNSNWNTKVSGMTSSYAMTIGKALSRINNLLSGTVDSDGLYELMIDADILARQISVLYDTYDTQIGVVNSIEAAFSTAMGDMLRDGYWNDSNYIVGQEDKLYADAQEIIEVMAQPVANYSVNMVDLYEAYITSPQKTEETSLVADIETSIVDGELSVTVPSSVAGISFPTPVLDIDGDLESTQIGDSMNVTFSLESGFLLADANGYLASEYEVPSWQDIDIDFCVHLIDEEIGISDWGFIEKISKCYDNPWETDINISTKKSDINGQSFTDILASVAAVAEEVRGKADVYDRSRVISDARTLSADALQGIIDVNRNAMLSTMSNWGTDNNGNIVFTALDESSAMMLTGSGFMIANSKTLEGDWDWRT